MKQVRKIFAVFAAILVLLNVISAQQLQTLDDTDSLKQRREKTNTNFQMLLDKANQNFTTLNGKPTIQSYTRSTLPLTVPNGTIATISNDVGGAWLRSRVGKWFQIGGEVVNVDEYSSLAAAVSDASTNQRTIVIPNTQSVSSNLTIPANVLLNFTGGGQISVANGVTLTIQSDSRGWPLRQIFSGSGTVRFAASVEKSYPQWFGAAMNGSTDDTTAIQKAVDAFTQTSKPHAGGDVPITGGTIISSTVTIQKNSIRLIGQGWGVSNESPYGGFLKWNGAAGIPMVVIQDCWGSGVENLRLIGKSSTKPSAAIEYKRNGDATTQLNHSFARNIWIGPMFGYDSDDAIQFDAGIVFSGSIDGDTNHFEQVVVNKATIGVDLQNGNGSVTHFDTLKITHCPTGIRNNTFIVGTNWNFGGNTLDMQILGDKHINVVDLTTEGASQFATLGINAKLFVKHGGFQITSAIPGSGIVIDAANPGGSVIVLEDCRFVPIGGYSGPNWIIKARNTGGAYKGYLRLINCDGISADNLDVSTTGGGLSDLREVFINRRPNEAYDWGTHSHVYLTNSATLEENRYDFASKVNVFGGPLTISQLAAPSNVTATPTGSGATTHSYKVVAKAGSGKSLASSAATCTNAATLDSTHYNLIRWYPTLGADSYEVYGRTGGSELLIGTVSVSKIFGMADGVTVTSFKDNGSVTPSGALPASNTTGGLSAAGMIESTVGGFKFPDGTTQTTAPVSPVGAILSVGHLTGTTVSASSTSYNTFGVCGAASTLFTTGNNGTESQRQIIVPIAGTLTSFYVRTNSAQDASGSLVLTVRINGVDTGITITIVANAGAGTFSDTTHTASVAAGDLVSFSLVNNATATSAALVQWAIAIH